MIECIHSGGDRAYLVGEEVEDIAQLAAVGGVELGIVAAVAGHGAELAILHVEDFMPESTGGTDLAYLTSGMTALGADIVKIIHSVSTAVCFR